MNLEKIVNHYKSKGLLLDSNLLLVFCVGAVDRNLIQNFKHTRAYSANDYDLLLEFIESFENKVFTTPNIMTEVNNLGGHLKGKHKDEFQKEFGNLAAKFLEEYTKSSDAVKISIFHDCGLADSIAFSMAQKKDGYLLLTGDFKLAGKVEGSGGAVLNFNHIRYIPPAD